MWFALAALAFVLQPEDGHVRRLPRRSVTYATPAAAPRATRPRARLDADLCGLACGPTDAMHLNHFELFCFHNQVVEKSYALPALLLGVAALWLFTAGLTVKVSPFFIDHNSNEVQ